MNDKAEYFVTCPKGLEDLLMDELRRIGGQPSRQTVAGVYCSATLENMYRMCLWSRLANRVLLPLAKVNAENVDELYRGVNDIEWEQLFLSGASMVIDFIGTDDVIRNTQFGAQKIKDAIVDRFVSLSLDRPNIDKSAPDIRINAKLTKQQVIISLDLSGDSLHRRGYRVSQGGAPLKENLAAALLIRAGWPERVQNCLAADQPPLLIDPMCGSGTLLIEAALMAENIPPGALREKFGFEKLTLHDKSIWNTVRTDAESQRVKFTDKTRPHLCGRDADTRVVNISRNNASHADLSIDIDFATQDIDSFVRPASLPEVALDELAAKKIFEGLVICNPPYGERLGEVEQLHELYFGLSRAIKQALPHWQLAVFTSNKALGKALRLRPSKRYQFFNGALAAELLLFEVMGGQSTLREDTASIDLTSPLSEGGTMVFNRIQKNIRRMEPWRKREQVQCYRAYDADMPEYSAAVDVYGDMIHVQEYQAPKEVPAGKARRRLAEIVHACAQVFSVEEDRIFSKLRKRNRGKEQYEKLEQDGRDNQFWVCEGRANFLVNLTDYLDTGLFLDHRPLRKRIGQSVQGKRFLNLFCYTATASVHAVLGGAASSVSVDMSNTYLDWARKNFDKNNIRSADHRLERADCLEWLKSCREGFDVIMLDPPSFSNSKKMESVLDIQRDHVGLIQRCMELLDKNGVVYFSTNLRSFKLDNKALGAYKVVDITKETLDPDFKRNHRIHSCWTIQHR